MTHRRESQLNCSYHDLDSLLGDVAEESLNHDA